MGVKCNKCGEEGSDTAKFCGNCGAALLDEVEDSSETEGQEYDGPWRLTEVVQDWLKEMEWEEVPVLNKAAGISRVAFLIDAEGSECTCYLEAWETQEVCKFFMYAFDDEVPTDRIGECLELANQINNSRVLGYFTVADMEKQVIRCYVSVDVEGATFEPRHIHNVYGAGLAHMEAWMPKFRAVCNEGKSAADVIAEID